MERPKLPQPPKHRWEDKFGLSHINEQYDTELEQWTKDLIKYLQMHLEGDSK